MPDLTRPLPRCPGPLRAGLVLALVLGLQGACGRRQEVSSQKVHAPWMIVAPWTYRQPVVSSYAVPYADRTDPGVLYLVEEGRPGEVLKVNLAARTVEPRPAAGADLAPLGPAYPPAFLPGPSPLASVFKGRTYDHTSLHGYGFPFATQPRRRTATFADGSWTLVDQRDAGPVELVTYTFKHLEKTSLGFDPASLYLSPDRTWLVYRLPHTEGILFIFNRRQDPGPADPWVDSAGALWTAGQNALAHAPQAPPPPQEPRGHPTHP